MAIAKTLIMAGISADLAAHFFSKRCLFETIPMRLKTLNGISRQTRLPALETERRGARDSRCQHAMEMMPLRREMPDREQGVETALKEAIGGLASAGITEVATSARQMRGREEKLANSADPGASFDVRAGALSRAGNGL